MSQNAALRMEIYQLRKALQAISDAHLPTTEAGLNYHGALQHIRDLRKTALDALAANDTVVRDPLNCSCGRMDQLRLLIRQRNSGHIDQAAYERQIARSVGGTVALG